MACARPARSTTPRSAPRHRPPPWSRGPGWSPVGSWEAVARSVADQGPGAAAFVLARRQGDALGHAWAAYHLGGFDGVMWVDLSARDGRQLSSAPPPVAASEARAMVVGPAGRAVESALPAFAASSSTPHALLDAATARAYGAIGLEIERRLVFVISGLGDVPAKQTLATAPGFTIVTDHASVTRTADGRLHLRPFRPWRRATRSPSSSATSSARSSSSRWRCSRASGGSPPRRRWSGSRGWNGPWTAATSRAPPRRSPSRTCCPPRTVGRSPTWAAGPWSARPRSGRTAPTCSPPPASPPWG
ncbi:toxin glutamine deamidase domain-containing protein [Streptomyces sp. S1A(2023)]